MVSHYKSYRSGDLWSVKVYRLGFKYEKISHICIIHFEVIEKSFFSFKSIPRHLDIAIGG